MSEEGERSCPLCAEEMDLTDQQLKPCKCGYEICVWCWHHIMDMAEKDNTEGRCPACRTPYSKEKIVGTASKCEGLVNGMSVEKRQKSQKGKTKTLEGRNQLGNVRVIQRNLVYIVGLPLDLADEDLLQQKEYFGRYGKVLKVSISRTAAGAIQQFANSTCSVYITYSKEEEAIRSIKSTHGFVLEGRPLRACFGTTKYCHAWLRNSPCTNADCLYLHEFGRQEDSFTKDEIVSEYTRVQQITGVTNDMQRRSGNLLPPPADEYSNNNTSAWPKPVSKSTTNNLAKSLKVSPPNSSSQRSVALPAAASWGTRASNSQPVLANVASSNGPSKEQADLSSSTLSFSAAVVSPPHVDELVSKHCEESHTSQEKGNLGNLVTTKKVTGLDHKGTLSETPVTSGLPSCSISSCQVSTTSLKNKSTSKHSSNLVQDKDLNVADIGRIDNSFSNMSLISTDKNKRLQASEAEEFAKPLDSNKAEYTAKQSDLVSDFQNNVAEIVIGEVEEDLPSFNDQRLSDKEIVTHTSLIQSLPNISPCPNISMGYSHQHAFVSANGNLNPPSVVQNLDKAPQHEFNVPVVNGHSSLDVSNGYSYFHGTEGGRSHLGRFEEAAAAEKGDHSTGLDIGENSIISNILSMDFDPWDESLTSPQNLAKFLGESNKQPESHRVLSSRKAQNSNQSRFSFARQDECTYQGSNYESNASDFGQGSEYKNFSPDFVSNNSNYLDNKLSNGNGFPSFSSEESNRLAKNFSHMSENKLSVQTVSRTQVSAPPGFSGPSRAPPPGFSSHERMEQTYDHASGNYTFDNSSLMRKAHQATVPVNFGGAGDLELMDPAILAVSGRVPSGLEMRSNFPAQPNSFENDVRLQLLMQTSFSHQNHRFTQLGDNYPHQTDPYGISSRMGENHHLSSYQQNSFQQPRSSLNVNGHWNSWNEAQGGNEIGMADLLRNERMGFNRYYSGYEDSKYQLPTSGDLYNRTYGI